MAVTLTGSNGLFTRLGKIWKVEEILETLQSDLDTEIEDVTDEYNGADLRMIGDIRDRITELQRGSHSAVFTSLQKVAEKTLIEMVNDDTTLPSKSVDEALEELFQQMVDNSDGPSNSNTIGGSTSSDGDNDGTGDLVVNTNFVDLVKGNSTYTDSQNVRPDTVKLVCVNDAQISGTAGRETFSVRGNPAFTDPSHPDWPGGNGINSTLRVVNPSEDAKEGVNRNHLTNSDFEDFTSDSPDNWTVVVGTPGTDLDDDASTVYRGSKSLKINGDSSTLVSLYQEFDNSGQTTARLKPRRHYAVKFRVSASASVAAGTLRVRLENASGTALWGTGANYDLTAVSNGSFDFSPDKLSSGREDFITATDIPDTVRLVVELTTAITNGQSINIDDLCLFELQHFGAPGFAGPAFALVRGDTDFVLKDNFTRTITNNNNSKIHRFTDKYFDLFGRGTQLVDQGNTISDSLIA